MNKLIPYSGVVLMINEVIPTLEKDGVIYAHLIKAEDRNGRKYTLRERSGLPIAAYVGKPMECILEVLTSDFEEPNISENKLPDDFHAGKYLWAHSGYKFIPELLEMIEGHENEKNYDYDEDEYDRIAEGLFCKWGVCGLGLDADQNKPMVETENGVFLFNEYQNEDIIEEWELNQSIYFRPKEILLRGIKPYEGKWETKHKAKVKGEEPLKHYEKLIVGKPRIIDPW